MIVQSHGALLAAVTKRKPGKTLLAERTGNLKSRITFPHLSPFQTTRVGTLPRKTTQDPNKLNVAMDVSFVPNVLAKALKSFIR